MMWSCDSQQNSKGNKASGDFFRTITDHFECAMCNATLPDVPQTIWTIKPKKGALARNFHQIPGANPFTIAIKLRTNFDYKFY